MTLECGLDPMQQSTASQGKASHQGYYRKTTAGLLQAWLRKLGLVLRGVGHRNACAIDNLHIQAFTKRLTGAARLDGTGHCFVDAQEIRVFESLPCCAVGCSRRAWNSQP